MMVEAYARSTLHRSSNMSVVCQDVYVCVCVMQKRQDILVLQCVPFIRCQGAGIVTH
jgi:hypothetical protein